MTPLERLEYQRRNRRVLYAVLAGIGITACVLRIFQGVM